MPITHEELLDFYRRPGIFTGVDGFEAEIDALPAEAGALAEAVQQLLLCEGWAPAYAVTAAPDREEEKQMHSAVAMLTQAARLHDAAIGEPRPPDRRVLGVCRHFATLFTAFARRKGIAARVRAGFADYFHPGNNGSGRYSEHWVSEYWRTDQRRWVLVDSQIDAVQSNLVRPDFDVHDVPRDRFLVAGDAWRACRDGADPMTFGVSGTQNWGLVEVFGEILQDLAALQSIELLPWGWYGLALDETAMDSEAGLVDSLAQLSSAADADALETLAQLARQDRRLAVPAETLKDIVASEARATHAQT